MKEQEKVKILEKENEKQKLRMATIEKEMKEKEVKYLDLYMENS